MRWKKYKRAVSPVVSTIFLTAVMVAAIGLALLIVLPQIDELNDNVEVTNVGTQMISMDDAIKKLIISGEGSNVYKQVDIGATAFTSGDTSSEMNIYLFFSTDGGAKQLVPGSSIYRENYNRLVFNQTVASDVYPTNSHSYLVGSGFQNLFFINNTLESIIPWSIINQSRGDEARLTTALSYRGIIDISKYIDVQNFRVNLTIQIQLVEFVFTGELISYSSTPSFTLSYNSLNTTLTPWNTLNRGSSDSKILYLRTDTTLEGITTVEWPFSHEVPKNGALGFRFEFVKHVINISF